MRSRWRASARASRLVHHHRDWRRAVTTRTQSAEEYLEAIFKLQRGTEPVTVKRLADRARPCRRPPSPRCSAACARPASSRSPPRAAASRSPRRATSRARRLVRRHRLSERFLVDYLDMPWDAVHDEACKLEHVLSPEVEARLAEQLGNPLTCPHGHAIPGEDGSLAEEELRPLSGLEPGDEARHRLHHRGEERPAALPRLARPAPRHAGRRRERRALQRAAARARRRLAVRPRARGDRQDHGPRLTPMATDAPPEPPRGGRIAPARTAAGRLPRRQPQRRQVVAVQRPHRRVARDRRTAPA